MDKRKFKKTLKILEKNDLLVIVKVVDDVVTDTILPAEIDNILNPDEIKIFSKMYIDFANKNKSKLEKIKQF